MKTCSRCKQIKPISSFSRRTASKDGHQGWCKDCAVERVRQWHNDNPTFVFPSKTAKLTARDALQASYRHCAHIARYTQRAITRIEQSGLEAPPQLMAIKDLAQRLADEQHALINRRTECEWCGKQFIRKIRGARQRFCSDSCRYAQRDHERMTNDPDYNRKHYAKHRQRYLDYSKERYRRLRSVHPH